MTHKNVKLCILTRISLTIQRKYLCKTIRLLEILTTYIIQVLIGLFQKKYTPTPLLTDNRLVEVGVDSTGNLCGRGNLNLKILPRGSLITLTLIDMLMVNHLKEVRF